MINQADIWIAQFTVETKKRIMRNFIQNVIHK